MTTSRMPLPVLLRLRLSRRIVELKEIAPTSCNFILDSGELRFTNEDNIECEERVWSYRSCSIHCLHLADVQPTASDHPRAMEGAARLHLCERHFYHGSGRTPLDEPTN